MSSFRIFAAISILASHLFLGGCFQISTTEDIVSSSHKKEENKNTPLDSNTQLDNETGRSNQSYRVISVGDGDTIRVTDSEDMITVRLACVDAAELKQIPYGDQAQQRLQAILPIESLVSLKQKTVDRYDRVVAEVFKDDININLALVAEGQAVVYHEYLSQCESDKYLTAEEAARSKGLAFWSQTDPIMPWDFRRGDRNTSTQYPRLPETTDLNCDSSYPTVCIPPAPPDLNCGDIAHRRFKVIGSDPHRFDGDRNGIGCESR